MFFRFTVVLLYKSERTSLMPICLTYERCGDLLVLRNVGRHDETLENT